MINSGQPPFPVTALRWDQHLRDFDSTRAMAEALTPAHVSRAMAYEVQLNVARNHLERPYTRNINNFSIEQLQSFSVHDYESMLTKDMSELVNDFLSTNSIAKECHELAINMMDVAHTRLTEQSPRQPTTVRQRLSGFLQTPLKAIRGKLGMSSSRNTSSSGLLTKSDSMSSLDELRNRLGDNDPDKKDTVAHDVTWDSNIHDSVMAKLSSQVMELDPLLENEELDDESCDVTGDQSDETRTMTRRTSMRLHAHTASSKQRSQLASTKKKTIKPRACEVTNSKPKSTSAGGPADVTSIPETQLSPEINT